MVIPALEESEQIAGAIETAQAAGISGGDRGSGGAGRVEIEVVVVDGRSLDETAYLARRAGARVLLSEGGRARQLEVGWRAVDADVARELMQDGWDADVVLFLHADTRLPGDWVRSVCNEMRDPNVAGGAFRLRFDAPGWALRVVELFVRVRVAVLGLPYGDQAIFVRRSVLEAIGGLRPVPIMEDLDLVKAMKLHGRVLALPLVVTTSARRYLDHGIGRTLFRHALALLAWRAGLNRARVAAWYGQ